MAISHLCIVDQIGDVAGTLWHHLNQQGPRSLTQLAKDVDAPRDVILQAIGWLAREGKLTIEEDSRGRKTVSLRD
jgi:hypothetical protein